MRGGFDQLHHHEKSDWQTARPNWSSRQGPRDPDSFIGIVFGMRGINPQIQAGTPGQHNFVFFIQAPRGWQVIEWKSCKRGSLHGHVSWVQGLDQKNVSTPLLDPENGYTIRQWLRSFNLQLTTADPFFVVPKVNQKMQVYSYKLYYFLQCADSQAEWANICNFGMPFHALAPEHGLAG